MQKCLIDLMAASTQISPRYFRALGTRYNQTQYPQNIEQSFSAELFHRFKSIMEQIPNLRYYRNLILHFDITKMAIDSRPDLVLHEAQENRNNQKMFIEVKTDPEADLTNDFDKLIMATESYLQFENAVLIVVNRPFEETHNLILNHDGFSRLDREIREKISVINIFHNVKYEIDYNLYNLKYLPIRR